jgi:hypothetical protein
MISEPRPLRTARRIFVKTLRIIAGIIGGTVLYFFCERMFAGYHQYGTQYITYVGLGIVMAVGGYAWIIDDRHLDAAEHDAHELDADQLDADEPDGDEPDGYQ